MQQRNFKMSSCEGGNPSDWHTTYQPPSQNPIHNPPTGFDPKGTPPGLGSAAKWLIGGRLLYEMHDEYQQRMKQIGVQPYIAPRDNTNVIITNRPR